jgi:HK97 family phage major capsid protein
MSENEIQRLLTQARAERDLAEAASDPTERSRHMEAADLALQKVENARARQGSSVFHDPRGGVGIPPDGLMGMHRQSISANDPTMQPEYRTAFERFLRTAGGQNPMHSFPYGEAERRVLETAADVLGGYTVPTDLQNEIIRRLPAASLFLSRLRIKGTVRDVAEWPTVQGKETDGSIYTSAFVGAYVSETPAADAAAAEPSFGMASAPIKKARAIAYVSRDLAADSAFDILGLLRDDGGDNLALVMERGVIAGTGVAGEPTGILNTPDISTTTLDIGPTANHIDSATDDQDAIAALISLAYSLPGQYAANAVMVMQRATEGELRALVQADGTWLWPVTAPPGQRFLGLEPIASEFMQAVGTDGHKVILVCDPSQIILVIRDRLSVQVLMEKKADEEQIGIILRTRHAVLVPNTDALRIGVV